MLQHKQDIIHHAHKPQRKLDGITRNPTPVMLQVAINRLLRNAQHTTDKIKQNLPDAPAAGALVARIGNELGRKLDERDEQLDVSKGVDDVEVAPVDGRVGVIAGADNDVRHHDARDGTREDAEREAAGSAGGVVRKGPETRQEVLRDGEDAEDAGVQRKDNVVEGDGGREARVAGGVLLADAGGVVEG